MDLSTLEKIVAKRKLPPTSENKKKRRRITPTSLLSTDAVAATIAPSSFSSSVITTAPDDTARSPSLSEQRGTSTTLVNYYYQQDKDLESNDVSPQCIPSQLTPAYNTSIGYFESTLIVKQKFYLSDTIYVLIGMDADSSFDPAMYIVDKKWWMQIEIYPDCLSTIMYFRKRIDDFFATPRLITDFHPLYMENMKILPSKNSEPTIRLQRYRNHLAQTLDWEDPEINAIFNFIEDRPTPEITINREEWNTLTRFSESIIEYHQLCSACKPAANRLMVQYVKDFKNLFRQMAVAANSQHEQSELVRVKEEIKKQLPLKVKNHHYSRLIIEAADYNRGILSPFGAWLDAELRALCNEQVANKVIEELSSEFPWLKN